MLYGIKKSFVFESIYFDHKVLLLSCSYIAVRVQQDIKKTLKHMNKVICLHTRKKYIFTFNNNDNEPFAIWLSNMSVKMKSSTCAMTYWFCFIWAMMKYILYYFRTFWELKEVQTYVISFLKCPTYILSTNLDSYIYQSSPPAMAQMNSYKL